MFIYIYKYSYNFRSSVDLHEKSIRDSFLEYFFSKFWDHIDPEPTPLDSYLSGAYLTFWKAVQNWMLCIQLLHESETDFSAEFTEKVRISKRSFKKFPIFILSIWHEVRYNLFFTDFLLSFSQTKLLKPFPGQVRE